MSYLGLSHFLVIADSILRIVHSFVTTTTLSAIVHGRGVIHRDVKPSNCILAIMPGPHRKEVAFYDWQNDLSIWSNGEDGKESARNHRWKLMLVDFGFARALEKDEIDGQAKKMRNSIAYELIPHEQQQLQKQMVQNNGDSKVKAPEVNLGREDGRVSPKLYTPYRTINSTIPEGEDDGDDSIELDMAKLDSMVSKAVDRMRTTHFVATNSAEKAIMSDDTADSIRERYSGVSMPILTDDIPTILSPEKTPSSISTGSSGRRISSARQNVRSMSALGTKAYAAPEIRKQLRHKNEADFEKSNAAMTECVADYGMIVDAYSVGWTLRVAMTGVPPSFTFSEYMHERDAVVLEDRDGVEDPVEQKISSCCCFGPSGITVVRLRDPSMLPPAATLLITSMTEKKPEDRMTVREAQNNAWITAMDDEKEDPWVMPVGDYPSQHGDPVVTLKCAELLSQLTVKYHMQ